MRKSRTKTRRQAGAPLHGSSWARARRRPRFFEESIRYTEKLVRPTLLATPGSRPLHQPAERQGQRASIAPAPLMTALGPRALAACSLGQRQLCSGDAAHRSARAVVCRRSSAARHWAAVRTAEAARRAAHRAQRAHGRASAREPDASWRGDWDASAGEAPAYEDGDEEEGGLAGMRFEWAEWLNRVCTSDAAWPRLTRGCTPRPSGAARLTPLARVAGWLCSAAARGASRRSAEHARAAAVCRRLD